MANNQYKMVDNRDKLKDFKIKGPTHFSVYITVEEGLLKLECTERINVKRNYQYVHKVMNCFEEDLLELFQFLTPKIAKVFKEKYVG